jgi:hypothetical protein
MGAVAPAPRKPFLVAGVVLMLSAGVSQIATLPAARQENMAALERQMEQQAGAGPEAEEALARAEGMIGTITLAAEVTSVVGAMVVAWVLLAARGLFLHFAGTFAGGESNLAQMIAVAGWAYLPRAVGDLVLALMRVLSRQRLWEGLGGFAISQADGSTAAAWFFPLLQRLDIWSAWTAMLLVIGTAAATRVTRRRAAVVVGVYWLVSLLVALGGWALERAASNLLGVP